ncbi:MULTISPECIES: terminase large subunit domain-containing protein [Clostridium]|uniref:terminase large subunit domain-containing protein n=1 Tax=Clostridium TaxID=1485 RepID=UPI000826C7BA|nr:MULTISPECIES: terminase large subunit [Clostridium]PJI07656.1 terminase [Clostridium sp. CT7]
MALSISNAKKLKWLWQDGHEIEWIGAFIKIVNKDTKTVPFILTPEQKEFVEGLSKFNIVLKSRQLGLSVCTVGLAIRQCIVYPNSACLLVSHDQKSCNTIFDKLKQQFNSLPSWLKPKTIANNRQEIKMCNGSKITCSCAGNKDVGRGDTLQLVHLSEFSFWKMPKKQLNSITQALAPEGKLIIESTANGLNEFHDLYFQAQNNENSYKSFFFNWIGGSTLFKKDYEKSVKIYKSKHNKLLTVDELDDEENELLKLGATMEQLMWRRLKVASSGLDMFHQEYPATPVQAFIVSGCNVFDNKRIDEVERAIINNKTTYIKKENIIDLPMILRNHYGRSFFIYKIAKSGERFYIGCDLSEGVGQDYSVIEVLNKDGEQVAEFYNNKLKPFQMAEIINAIGIYYNKALITVEKASGGHSVIERLRYEFRYMNMTKYKSYDQFNKMQWNIGFDTNNKTKSIIINDFVELFAKGQLKINSRRVLQEMKVFEINDNGSMAASGSNHDDSVMATALAIVSLKNPYYYTF